MFFYIIRNIFTVVILTNCVTCESKNKPPAVLIAAIVCNKGHTLPYFLTLLSNVRYPKDRISLWICNRNNVDNSSFVVKDWLKIEKNNYHDVDFEFHNCGIDVNVDFDHSQMHVRRMMELQERALQKGRRMWADYIWFLDCDSFTTDEETLTNLINKNETVVSPMLTSYYTNSNFWASMSDSYGYEMVDNYNRIVERQWKGCFPVPVIYGSILINLNSYQSDKLTFLTENLEYYDGPRYDDTIVFAISAKNNGIPLHVCNDRKYGYILPFLSDDDSLKDGRNLLSHLKMLILDEEFEFKVHSLLEKFVTYQPISKFGMDEIFTINLKRRGKRKARAEAYFEEFGIDATFVEAVDGKALDHGFLNKNISLMKEYGDPYHKRPMKTGEIGCFLSHYKIWEMVLERNYRRVIILEDDFKIGIDFREKLENLIRELDRLNFPWDLTYLGRKKLFPNSEKMVSEAKNLLYPEYSYWTIGYILTYSGAKKLIDAEPLKNLIPVDEFLPIMFDKHTKKDWSKHFENRNLIALSVEPLIIYPLKYTFDEGYISDTEDQFDFWKDEL